MRSSSQRRLKLGWSTSERILGPHHTFWFKVFGSLLLCSQSFRSVTAQTRKHATWCPPATRPSWSTTLAMLIFFSCTIRLSQQSRSFSIFGPISLRSLNEGYADHAQNLTRCIITEESGYCGKGKAARCQGYKCKGEGHYGVIDQSCGTLLGAWIKLAVAVIWNLIINLHTRSWSWYIGGARHYWMEVRAQMSRLRSSQTTNRHDLSFRQYYRYLPWQIGP